MRYNTAGVIYFSGTGSTEYAAKILTDTLIDKGVDTYIKSISDGGKIAPVDVMVLMYPVHAGDASALVYKFIKKLDSVPVPLTDLVILSVSAGGEAISNTSCRSKVIRKLLKKGYKTVYEDMLIMPNNFVTPYPDELNALLIKALSVKLENVTKDLISGKSLKKTPRLIDSVLRTLLEPFKLFANVSGKTLKADSKCTGCALCAENCPADNIIMKDNAPVFGWRCALCMKCVYNCPEQAIGGAIANAIKIKGGYDINKMASYAESIQFTYENVKKYAFDEAAIYKYLINLLNQ
ncbi:MAG: EFR1 family ferrodoxin [Christensenellales bacterium]|jgi:ferredoxin/flavodoxin